MYEFFDQSLRQYPDRNFILHGLVNGVAIGYNGAHAAREHPNWPSIIRYAKATWDVISDDVARSRATGPFDEPPHPDFVASPLGAFEKKRSGKVRVIHDLSWPPGGSVNDGIDASEFSLKYITLDDAVQVANQVGAGRPVSMAKLDLMNAFKHIFVRPEDRHLLGFTWDPSLVGSPWGDSPV